MEGGGSSGDGGWIIWWRAVSYVVEGMAVWRREEGHLVEGGMLHLIEVWLRQV